jgi:hypothetical protein
MRIGVINKIMFIEISVQLIVLHLHKVISSPMNIVSSFVTFHMPKDAEIQLCPFCVCSVFVLIA